MVTVLPQTGTGGAAPALVPCGYGNTCFHFTCQAFTCVLNTCHTFTCHVGWSGPIPLPQAAVAAGGAGMEALGGGGGAQPFYPCINWTGAGCPTHTVICVANTFQPPCPANTVICGNSCFLNTTVTCGCTVRTWCGAFTCLVTGGCGPITCLGTGCVAGSCAGTEVCTPTIDPGPWRSQEQFAAIKEQLKQALAEVEREEKAAEEKLRPQTVAEVDSLQKRLREALSDLDKRKQELEKKEKPSK